MRIRTIVERGRGVGTGLSVPIEVVDALGSGRRPPVQVALGELTYRSTVASMDGRFFVPLSAANREAANVTLDDEVEIDIVLDTAPREVVVPADLAEALAHNPAADRFFSTLSYTDRKEWVRWVEEAKKPITRASRIGRSIDFLEIGRRSR